MPYIKRLASILFGAVLLTSVALYNGYPLVEGDSGSYIYLAFKFMLPPDRAPFYGTFLGISGFWATLWLPVFIQNVMLSWLIYEVLRLLSNKEVYAGLFITTIILSALFTHIAWVSNVLMPDVFTSILLLAIVCYCTSPAYNKRRIVFLCVMVVSIIMHNSHYLIFLLFAVLNLTYVLIKRNKKEYRSALNLFTVSCCGILLICCLNLSINKRFTPATGSHAFVIAKFGEMGLLNTYLDDKCREKHYKLCDYREDIPSAAWEFLWRSESPFYKTGGWDSSRQEYHQIIKEVFTTPKYMGIFIWKAIIATGRQLTQDYVYYEPQGYNSSPWTAINQHYFHELKEYFYSNQNLNLLKTSFFNYLCLLFFVGSSIWVVSMHHKVENFRPVKNVYYIIILFIICNAFVTGSLANVLNRLQVRVFWVLPFFNLVVLISYYANKYGFSRAKDKQI